MLDVRSRSSNFEINIVLTNGCVDNTPITSQFALLLPADKSKLASRTNLASAKCDFLRAPALSCMKILLKTERKQKSCLVPQSCSKGGFASFETRRQICSGRKKSMPLLVRFGSIRYRTSTLRLST